MSACELTPEEKFQLLEAAKAVLQNAYAPYSGFRVGAALLTLRGNLFTGCNVENNSYSLTLCAERTAIASAVAQEGGENMKIRAVAVVNEKGTSCPPCGACRQVIFEFGVDAIILLQEGSTLKQISIAELLPGAFQLK